MVILWTDALLLLLVLLLTAGAFWVRRNAALRRPCRTVAHSCIGMAALTILLLFLGIGLLDSIHYRDASSPSKEIISVLDAWLRPLRVNTEKTYSAPFAAYAYSRELMTDPTTGALRWDYPRLEYGGAHLADPARDKFDDLVTKTLRGLLKGLAVCGGASILAWLRRRRWPRAPSLRLVMALCSGIVVLGFTVAELAQFYHVLGTDKVGEDVLYQALKSIRTGLVIGMLTTLIMLPVAIVFGVLAGFFGNWIDDLIQYLYTTLNSIPSVLLIAASILVVQIYMANHEAQFTSLIVRADMRLLFLCLILGMTSWTGLCRLLRAETLKLREMEYVQAARALGVTAPVILYRHILPNVMPIVLIAVTLDFSALVLAEAVLSYINIGVDPTTYSWGNMINGARLEMAREPIVWWSLTAAFVFMFALVLAANLFADVVRDAFDPRRVAS